MRKQMISILVVSIFLFASGLMPVNAETFKVSSMIFGGYPPGAEMSFNNGWSWATYYSWYDYKWPWEF